MARQARAEITRDSVLAGAADVFLRLGYANASLSEIISQSNVTKGALYFHFGSKEELARAVVDQGNERLRGASGENITKTWGETQILLAERAIAQGDLKPDLDPETIGLLLQEMTAGVHITAVGTESIDQMAVRMERMWYFLLPSIVPDEKVAYFREFAARRLRRYVP